MEEFKALLQREFAPFGTLSAAQLDLLEKHFQLLLQWNSKLNLTRITSVTEAVRLHYCESLFLANFLPKRPLAIVDIGSGAGFPGIPIAVVRPECRVTLVEAHQRKGVFLSEAVRQLDLANVAVSAKRADAVKEQFDWIVSRAVNSNEVSMLRLAPQVAFLGSGYRHDHTSRVKMPWGDSRYLFHVERGGGST
jgi:16S rRNA (guanine527-N7)-methyltransferase